MNLRADSLRARKKRQTREALIETAYQLFEIKGYDQTTVEEIVGRAEYSHRTFYRYFPHKEEVVFPWYADRIARFRDLLTRLGDSDEPPLQVVMRALMEMARYYDQRKETMLRQYRIVSSSPVLVARDMELDNKYEQAIAEFIAEGSAAETVGEPRAAVVAGAIFGAVRAIMATWYASDCTLPLVDLAANGFQALKSGLGDL